MLTAAPGIAQDGPLTEHQGVVVDCLLAMEAGNASWPQCVSMMFAPCAEEQVATPGHVSCLAGEHKAWQAAMLTQHSVINERLTTGGSSELTQIFGGWVNAVAQNCAQRAASKEGDAAEATKLGCEISEIAGVVTEFAACDRGMSSAPYCVFQE